MLILLLILLVHPSDQSFPTNVCNSKLQNKVISFEYNYYPGYHLTPYSSTEFGYIMGTTWVGEKEYTSDLGTGWLTEKCGEHLCLSSLKTKWENYYLYMPSWGGTRFRLAGKLYHWWDVCRVGDRWSVDFDILCQDCNTMDHCNLVNRYKGSMEMKNYGRLMTDKHGWTDFGFDYGESYADWFDWKIHVNTLAGLTYIVLEVEIDRNMWKRGRERVLRLN